MNERIPDPIRGDDIMPWAQSVTGICRRFGATGSGNLLVREGPGGIGYEPLPEIRRGKTAAAPWSFACSEGGSGRTGGWYNCRLQIGYDLGWASPELNPGTDHVIGGCDHTEDGVHYLEVTLGDPDVAEIKVAENGVQRSDYVRGIICITLAEVRDGVAIGYLPHINPVIYKYV